MSARWYAVPGLVVFCVFLAVVPLVANDYYVALGINALSYAVLATAWGMFSGPTRYVSLATSALFGIGAYTVAALYERVSWLLLLLLGALLGGAVAVLVGLATLRLQGMYFTVFTFGLSELIRQLVTWYQRNVSGSVGVYVFLSVSQQHLYWALLALAVTVVALAVLVSRSRVGLALRMIGEDELAARHSGVKTTQLKLGMFAATSAFMAATGAVVAPRWTYLDPAIAFDPTISFLTVIIALVGGTNHAWGPVLGAIPLTLLFEVVTSRFPNHFMLLLGLAFVGVVYLLPQGVLGSVAGTSVVPASLRPVGTAPADGQRSSLRMDGNSGGALKTAEVRQGSSHALSANGAGQAGYAVSWRPSGYPGALLSVRDVRKAFGRVVAVNRVSFEVREGETLGIIGPNGSGKTTLLNIVSGATVPDGGVVELAGTRISGRAPEEVARLGVARTFQLVRVYPALTCLENVIPPLVFRSRPLAGRAVLQAAEEILMRVGLAGQAGVPAGQLTYIDQKRLELARALALGPRLLLLDEWLAGLNPSELQLGIQLIGSLKNSGITIVLVEHIMSAIRALCDRCVVMSFGEVLAEGPPSAVLEHPEVLKAYLGDANA